MTETAQPRVVIVGAGFGGLNAAQALARSPIQLTVIDRKNYHTFQPLLYQVATAGLSPGEIAAPIRSILRGHKNVEVLMAEVTGFDLNRRMVETPETEIPYDYLVVAAGARHSYFGHDEWEPFAPGLKTIEDALEIRRRVLLAFELAERQMSMTPTEAKEAATGEPAPPVNFVVVGGGPTGVELAGTLAEICHHALNHEFRSIDPARAHILLVEGGPRVLPAYPEDLSRSAEQQLHRLGVEVRNSTMVTQVEPGAVHFNSTRCEASVILWAAGVAASPLGKKLGAPVDRAGRVPVQPDLSLAGHPEVFVIGDLGAAKDEKGKMLPGVAPVAIQQGRFVAKLIRKELEGRKGAPFKLVVGSSGNSSAQAPAVAPPFSRPLREVGNERAQAIDASSRTPVLSSTGGGISRAESPTRPAFHYWDKGSLATIGRAAAVADFGKLHISGYFAWLSWLFVHIWFLIGFHNRLLVFIQWAWSYVTYERGARLITGSTYLPGWTYDPRIAAPAPDSTSRELHSSAK
jgi:NADH:ubiquinone reductase (H+-translocating)